MCRAALADARCADVPRQHVRVSLSVGIVVVGIKPSARGNGDDMFPNVVGNPGPGATSSPTVEDDHWVTVADRTGLRVFGIHDDWHGACVLYVREGALHLTVQLVTGLRRYEMERVGRCGRSAKPFIGCAPDRMARALVISKACNRLRVDLEPAGRGIERMCERILAKCSEGNRRVLRALNGKLDPVPPPQFVKAWSFDP